MKNKKWELAAMTAVTAFLMLGTKAEAMDDAYRMPQLSGVTKTWVYQGGTSDRRPPGHPQAYAPSSDQKFLPEKPGFIREKLLIRTGSVCLRMTRRTAILRP